MSLPRSRSRKVASTATSYSQRSAALLAKISLRHFAGRNDAGGRFGSARAPSRPIVFRISTAVSTGSGVTFGRSQDEPTGFRDAGSDDCRHRAKRIEWRGADSGDLVQEPGMQLLRKLRALSRRERL